MKNEVSRGQALEVVSKFATLVNWKEIDSDSLQKQIIELPPEEFGKRFTAFLKNGGQIIFGDRKFVQTKPLNLAEFLGKDWSIWKGAIDGDGLSGEEDVDQRSLTFSEIEIKKFIFESRFQLRKRSTTDEKELNCLKEKAAFIRFGGNVFAGLWEDYKTNKESSVLSWFYRNWGVSFINFPGLVLRDPFGSRYIFNLYRYEDNEAWNWHRTYLKDAWGASGYFAGCME